MKKHYTFLIILFTVFVGSAQNIDFEDAIFKSVLLSSSPSNQIAKNLAGNNFKIDTNNDGQISISEALQVGQISFINTNTTSLVGIENFTNLTRLGCNQNQITSLDVSALVNLTLLDCSSNDITSLNVNGLINLQNLNCQNNLLTSLDLTGLNNLNYINCQSNQLSALNLTGKVNLSSLYAGINQLTTLDVSDCYNLFIFGFNVNPIVSLFVKNGRSQSFLSFNATPTLQYICADDMEMSNLQSLLNTYGYTNCHMNGYCSFSPGGLFYTINGDSKFDADNSGCDVNDIIFPIQRFTATNGTISGSFISNESGTYSIPLPEGTHTISPVLENPTYFTVSPATATVSFPSATSPFTQDFCVTANGVKNDVEVTIIPIEVARPGFDAEYKIIYKNKGNQVSNGSLNFTFDDAIMDLVSATPVNDNAATNSLSWNYTNLNPFETREIDLVFNINSPMETPAVNGDDVLDYIATIVGATDETPNDNTFTLNQTVVNSYDPNDKTCLEGATITPSMVGQYVHYVIRFENTGTFAAENIVVKDMIDTTKFDVSTLIPQHSSHDFFTRINGNKVEFIFENINLPFDDANNDGYVAFKIKTKPTLVLGNTFTNSASIYF
ncbi:T9SS C-terminal target domain-containing protein, partial [Flavobacterium sp.]|uniref:DUF7619 domain-containing protein n=1 Tax=Flavobacterium sp. TaxID=239 RepID=UPI0022C08461